MERANTNNENGEGPSHTSPPPIEPYRPKAKYTINEIVTPRTIIPTCYFHVQSITYDPHAQSHMYTLKSLPYIGDHYQPNLTRTVFEDDLRSMSNIRKDRKSLPRFLRQHATTFPLESPRLRCLLSSAARHPS